jgi:hypothetical protein
VEKFHLKKCLTDEATKTSQLKCAFPKIDNIIKRFSRELLTLMDPRRKHVCPHIGLCKTSFEQWENYDKKSG